MFRRLDRASLEIIAAALDDAVTDLEDHFLEEESQVAARAEIRRSDIFYPVRMCAELVAFFETRARGIFGIVNGNRLTTVAPHDREARHIGRPVADINHVLKRNRTQCGIHVVIHILIEFQHTFVDAEEKLGFLRVADCAFGKCDAVVLIGGEFTAKDLAHIWCKATALDEFLHAGGHDVMLDPDSICSVLRGNKRVFEVLKHFRQSWIKCEPRTEFAKAGIRRAVNLEAIEKHLHVSQLVVVALVLHQLSTSLPEMGGIDSKNREDRLLLHVDRREGLVVVVNNRNRILRNAHNFQMLQTDSRRVGDEILATDSTYISNRSDWRGGWSSGIPLLLRHASNQRAYAICCSKVDAEWLFKNTSSAAVITGSSKKSPPECSGDGSEDKVFDLFVGIAVEDVLELLALDFDFAKGNEIQDVEQVLALPQTPRILHGRQLQSDEVKRLGKLRSEVPIRHSTRSA